MAQPERLIIDGLFGRLHHDIKLRAREQVTILTGPNGSGKTHALNILRCLVGLDFLPLREMPFESAEVQYSSGTRLQATSEGHDGPLTIRGFKGKTAIGECEVDGHEEDLELPPWLMEVGPDHWYDQREGRTISTSVVMRRYNLRRRPPARAVELHPWLAKFAPPARPIMIATGRLDLNPVWEEYAKRDPRRRPDTVARIVQYAERIQSQINEARRDSLMQSQRSDRGFAVRALDKARTSVKESELRSRYEWISELNQELHTNGLTEETVAVEIPAGRTNPTERRILNLFLDDWEEKLAPLLPIHSRLQLLKGIVGSKFAPKRLDIGSNGELQIISGEGDQISVDQLSSGEQHLLALYTMLLFTAAGGSLVLIDEPEISLHASWKHAFLTDIERVAELKGIQVVLATHSTGIINGRWELVEEIGSNGE